MGAEVQRRPSWKDIYSKRVQRQYCFSEKTKLMIGTRVSNFDAVKEVFQTAGIFTDFRDIYKPRERHNSKTITVTTTAPEDDEKSQKQSVAKKSVAKKSEAKKSEAKTTGAVEASIAVDETVKAAPKDKEKSKKQSEAKKLIAKKSVAKTTTTGVVKAPIAVDKTAKAED